MATTKKTAAKKTTAAKKSTAARTPAATNTSAAPGEQLGELRQLLRDALDIYVGVPYLLGARLSESATTPNVDLDALKSFVDDVKSRLGEVPSVDFDAVKAFVDEAKTVGHAQVNAFESQVVEALETGRARLRSLYAA